MRACWLAGLARSFQNPAARYFMALRGSPSHMSVVRVMVPVSFFRSVFFGSAMGGPCE
jgi:hypothetical protein